MEQVLEPGLGRKGWGTGFVTQCWVRTEGKREGAAGTRRRKVDFHPSCPDP